MQRNGRIYPCARFATYSGSMLARISSALASFPRQFAASEKIKMSKHRPGLNAFRGLLFAGYLATLASCGGSSDPAQNTGGTSTVTSSQTTVPVAPTGLAATAGNAEVTLSWTASSGAASYHVKRATTSGGPYTQLAAPTTTGYTDSSAANGTDYFYVVSAVDSAGESADSAQASATPEAPSVTLTAPTNLRAITGNAQVTLSWTASTGATSYHVKRATTSGGPYTQVAAPTSTSYTDTAVTNGMTYYYVVSAVDSSGESADSSQVSAALAASATAPTAPTGLSATAGNAQVALSWNASTGATSYHVKRATTSGGPYTQIAAPTSNSYTDTSAANGMTYYYVVSALDSTGESANSAQVSATLAATATAPSAPAGLKATSGNAQVALSWTASTGATSYHVKRATTSGGPYTQVAAPTTTTYTDTSVTNGTSYYYVVSALDSTGESANSAQVTGSPATASSISGLHVSGNQIFNGANQVVTLRGVDKSGSEYECLGGPLVFDGPSDAASVTTLKTWDINIVRLPLNEDCWLGINGAAVGGTAYQTAIVNYVNLLTAGNIATILDLQWAAPGTTLSSQLTPMPDADHAPAFWTSVATKFKGNSSVIFDLFNEPYPDSNADSTAAWTCLKNGGTCPGVSYTTVGTQSLVTTIRATGSTNIIMVPGVQYTNVLDQWLAYKPTDPLNSIAASWHSYAGQICDSSACWTSEIQPVLTSTPLIAGEIGENDCADVYIDPLMTFLDAHGGNYLAWGWDTYNCSSFPALISDYSGTPTAFGVGFHDHMVALNGQTPAGLSSVDDGVVTPFSTTYPFGIAVGSSTQYTASDGTLYYADVANSAMTESMQYFTPFTTSDTITGTSDPNLYQSGRTGAFGTWTINVPNGTYLVTLGIAPNSAHNAGEFGQDQTIEGQKAGTCVWSLYSGTDLSPTSNLACPQSAEPVPVVDVAETVTYNVTVTNQTLTIQPAASYGGGRTTILNTIKVAQAP